MSWGESDLSFLSSILSHTLSQSQLQNGLVRKRDVERDYDETLPKACPSSVRPAPIACPMEEEGDSTVFEKVQMGNQNSEMYWATLAGVGPLHT